MSFTPDGGGGYLSTDWSQWRVDQMAPVINGESAEQISKHADSWFKVFLAAAMLHQRVSDRRRQLADHWRGDAANAYFLAFDDMLKALESTKDAAYDNYLAMRDMSSTVKKAQQDMAPILARWEEYDREEADYRDNWAVYKVFVDNPVSAEERETLNNQARTVMYRASGGMFDSYTTMTPPPEYHFVAIEYTLGPDPDGPARSGGGGFGAPPIPPLRPQLPSPLEPGGTGDVPVLSGGAPPPAPVVTPPPAWTPTPEPNTGRPVVPPIIGSTPPPGLGTLPPGRSGPSNGSIRNGPTSIVGGRAGTAPAVIGGRQGPMGLPMAGMGAAGTGARVNPVGGVVGGGRGPIAVPKDNRRGRTAGHDSADPQHPFEVDTSHASPPVLEPDPEPDFRDPGPAIGAAR